MLAAMTPLQSSSLILCPSVATSVYLAQRCHGIPSAHLNRSHGLLHSAHMSTLAEIEAAVDALPSLQQEQLFRHLAERLRKQPAPKRRLPLVPASGRPITQAEIDDALDAD